VNGSGWGTVVSEQWIVDSGQSSAFPGTNFIDAYELLGQKLLVRELQIINYVCGRIDFVVKYAWL
jgi:hypothetical protein